jgi:hypothetical protein
MGGENESGKDGLIRSDKGEGGLFGNERIP